MIFFISDGRLGNQLFQYAFLVTIAKENEKIFAINMEQLLEGFDIENKNFKCIKLGKYTLFLLKKYIKPYILDLLIKFRIFTHIKQKRRDGFPLPLFEKQKGILNITIVNTDFYQSEKLFDPNKLKLQLKSKYIKAAQDFLRKIPENFTKVFVHIRRGDYVSEVFLGERGIVLPKRYYENAMKKISDEVENPFYVFLSDDPAYVEDCFSNLTNKIISYNNMYVDLAIMSLCEYGIISNSSFSWWGAYLMKKRKKVIFPKYWYGWKSKVEFPVGIFPDWAEILDV